MNPQNLSPPYTGRVYNGSTLRASPRSGLSRLIPRLEKTLAGVMAGLACCAALPGAHAQSSVTIYGRLNETVERQKSGDTSKWVLQNNSSRIGFKGTEDLGGGLSAGFQLESGFSADTGVANAAFWGRRSQVSLAGSFGQVRMGTFFSEAYFATADYVSMHNHDTGTSSDALYAYVTNDRNKVSYRTPSFGDATFEIARSFSEGVPGVDPSYDLAANYAKGPLQLGAGYSKTGDKHQFALRALYEFGAFTVGGYVQRDENAFAPVAPGRRTNVRLAAMYALENSEFHVNVGSAGNIGGLADSKASQATLGYNYNLSKR